MNAQANALAALRVLQRAAERSPAPMTLTDWYAVAVAARILTAHLRKRT